MNDHTDNDPRTFEPDEDTYHVSSFAEDQAPALLINPEASTPKLLGVAIARLSRHCHLLAMLATADHEVEVDVKELASTLRPAASEALALLHFIDHRLTMTRQVKASAPE